MTTATAIPTTMHAVIIQQYGNSDVLEFSSISVPQPKTQQLLIQNHATSINPIDWKVRAGHFRKAIKLEFPAILGRDYCGQVVATGPNCQLFKPGDWVYGLSDNKTGNCYAQYIVMDEKTVALSPPELTPLEAATIPLAGLTAWQALSTIGKLQRGQRVLINGATGGVGLSAVQIALALGADVTALASKKNHALLTTLGVKNCLDYHDYDFHKAPVKPYDLFFDAAGNIPALTALNQLSETGTFVSTIPGLHLLTGWLKSWYTKQTVRFVFTKPIAADLLSLNQLISEKKLQPHIFQTFSLQDIATAHKLSEEGHVVGKIALEIK